MRSYLLFILTLALIIINFSGKLKRITYAQKNFSYQITVNAYVPEHIGYLKTKEQFIASTNLENGLWVILKNKVLSGQQKKIDLREFSKNKSTTIIITAKL